MAGNMDAFSSFSTSKKDTKDDNHKVDASRVDIMDLFGNVDKESEEEKKPEATSAVKKSSSDGQAQSSTRRRRQVSQNRQVSDGEKSAVNNGVQTAAKMFENTEKKKSNNPEVNNDEDKLPSEITKTHIRIRDDNEKECPNADKDVELKSNVKRPERKPIEEPKEEPVEEQVNTPTRRRRTQAQPEQSEDKLVGIFRHSDPPIWKIATDVAKYKLLERRFTKGRLILALDEEQKPLMELYMSGNELMAYKYLGTSLDVRIPAYVGKLPVRYVYGKMFTSMLDIFDRNGVRNLKESLTGKDVINVSKESIKESFGGIKSVVFPETLVELPARLFYRCYSITEIVIPASVVNISKWFLYSSGIRDIYFNGKIPEEFHNCSVSQDIFIHTLNGGQ